MKAYPPTTRYSTAMSLKHLNRSLKSEFAFILLLYRQVVEPHQVPGRGKPVRRALPLPELVVKGAVQLLDRPELAHDQPTVDDFTASLGLARLFHTRIVAFSDGFMKGPFRARRCNPGPARSPGQPDEPSPEGRQDRECGQGPRDGPGQH